MQGKENEIKKRLKLSILEKKTYQILLEGDIVHYFNKDNLSFCCRKQQYVHIFLLFNNSFKFYKNHAILDLMKI